MVITVASVLPTRIRPLVIIGLPFAWAMGLVLFMNVTSPLQSGPLSVLAVFVLLYLTIASTLYAISIIVLKIASLFGRETTISRRQLYYLMSVVGLGPVFILALNTLGHLEVKEVVLVTLLVIMSCFYVLRRGRREA